MSNISVTTSAKRERIPTRLRKQVWESALSEQSPQNMSSAEGKCVVCRCPIHILSFECAHIVSCADGGKTVLKNLLPCCSMCNRSMGKMNLFEYIQTYHPENLKLCPYYSGTSASTTSNSSSNSSNTHVMGASDNSINNTSNKVSPTSNTKTSPRLVKAKVDTKKQEGFFDFLLTSIGFSNKNSSTNSNTNTSNTSKIISSTTSASNKTTSAIPTSHCAHILEKGANKGKYCSVKPLIGGKYCSRHSK